MEVTGNGKHWVCIFRHLSNWSLCLSVLLLKPGHFGMLVVLWKWASQSGVLAFQHSGCHRGIITLPPSIAEQLEIWSPTLIFRLVSGKTSWGIKCLNDFCKRQTVSTEMDWKMLRLIARGYFKRNMSFLVLKRAWALSHWKIRPAKLWIWSGSQNNSQALHRCFCFYKRSEWGLCYMTFAMLFLNPVSIAWKLFLTKKNFKSSSQHNVLESMSNFY